MPDTTPPAPGTRGRLVVLDAMPLLYRGHFAMLRRPRLTSSGFNTSALHVFANVVREMALEKGATHVALAMDAGATFRHEKFPAYKAQREKLPEDIAASIEPAEEFARAMRIPFLRVKGFEADDIMGSLAAQAAAEGLETWLVSPDKDMAQLVGPLVTLWRPSHVPGENSEAYNEARVCEEWGLASPAQMVDYLAMAGDTADNIPGIPGVGPKTARELIGRFGSLEGTIEHAAQLKGKLAEKVAAGADSGRLSLFLARIRTDAPLPLSLEELRRREPDLSALDAFCTKFEMHSLAAKFGLGPRAAAASADGATVAPAPAASAAPTFRTAENTPHSCRLAKTTEDLTQLVAELAAAAEFAFDTETTGLDPRLDRAVGLSFSTAPGTGWYVPVRHDEAQPSAQQPPRPAPPPAADDLFAFFAAAESAPPPPTPPPQAVAEAPGFPPAALAAALGPIFADRTKVKCGHNAKFDIHVLRGLGIEVAPPIADSMLAHYVIEPSRRHGMDALAREYLGYDPIPIERLIGPRGKDQLDMGQVPVETVAEYAAEDADVTLSLHRELEGRVREGGAWRAYSEAENPLVPVLADMEATGIRLDAPALSEYGERLGAEITETVARIYELAGENFNIDSPQQLARILFSKLGLPPAGKTSTGQPSTSEEVLQSLQTAHPILPLVLEYRTLSKLKSTYADKLPRRIDPRDGRVHTTFQQATTETGRLSSDNPNLQNIPIRTERGKPIRAAFLAADDHHRLLSADYSQIELRVMAALSEDAAMLEAFRTGQDIHAATAARVYGIDPADVTREQRAHCKQVSFGIIYGISAFGLAQRLGIPRARADELIKAYFETFPGIEQFMKEAVSLARRTGFATTLLGRRRPLPDISSRNGTIRAAAERVAVNTPVQGTAADLVKLAMVAVHSALRARGMRSRMVLQVHDELVLDCPEEEVANATALVREAMENAMPLAVPLKVDIGVGANWLEAH